MDETFDNNNNNWKVFSDSNFKVKIEGGLLHLQKYEKNRINKSCLWYKKEIPNFNTSTDFSITFYAKVLSSDDLFTAIDLQWGFRNAGEGSINRNDSLYQADFILDGRVHLSYFDKKWNYLYRVSLPDTTKKITTSTPITVNADFAFPYKKDAFNKFEIIQKGDTCIIKVNDIELINKPIRRIYGNSIGIQKCLKSSIVIDRIIVKQDNWY